MRADDPAAADLARRRLPQKSFFPRLPSFPSRTPSSTINVLPLVPAEHTTNDILIDDAHLSLPVHDEDTYRWAVLYENQRGITLFSTPFYSPLSLLPSDPQPFTIPNNSNPRTHHPNLSLDNYPLPDGTWRWVSTAWMIDMRSGRGEVQHDGFEYNWSFRDNHWHAQVGQLGTAAWVRRRRWVRLMMRPATHVSAHDVPNIHPTRTQLAMFSSPSLAPSTSGPSSVDLDHHAIAHVWDGAEQDWQHVHRLLRQLGRDGRKLELWKMWLGPYAQTHDPISDIKGKTKQSDPSSKIVLEENLPPLVHLTTVLRNHGEAILRSFVFPDTRARFVDLVARAGLAKDLESHLGRPFSSADVDFWSYVDRPLDSD